MTRIAFVGAGSVEFTRDLLGDLLASPSSPTPRSPCTTSTRSGCDGRGDGALDEPGARRPCHDRGPPRPPRGARRRRLRDQHDPGRRPRGDPDRLRDPQAPRPAPDDRRHARDRRHLPRAAHDPGAAGHRRRHGRAVPGRLAAELHQPDGDAVLGDLRGQRPERASSASATRCRTRPASSPNWSACPSTRSRYLRRRRQPPVLDPALRARRRGSLSVAGRGASIATPSCAAACAVEIYRRFGYFPTESSEHSAEYLPWLPAPRRRDRAVPDAGRRVRAPHRGEPRDVRTDARASWPPASRSQIEREPRVRAR